MTRSTTELNMSCRGDRSYRFTPARTAVLVIDLQREFFADDTDECHAGMLAILPRVERVLAFARELGCRIIHTRESYQADLSDVHAYRRSLDYVGKGTALGRFVSWVNPAMNSLNAYIRWYCFNIAFKRRFGSDFAGSCPVCSRDNA